MARFLQLLSLAAFLFSAVAAQAASDRRVALVIGNSAYSGLQPLANPAADAADMADLLASMGYEVIRARDLTKDGFKNSTQEFLARITDADVALLFYAGHAIQVETINYLLPVDAVLKQPTDVMFDAVPLQDIVRLMERRARASIVLVDACRDNPLGQQAVRNGVRGVIEHGLAAENASDGSYLAFAAQPGKPSFDGQGRNSPFTQALLAHLDAPDVDIRLVMTDVREAVAKATDYRQVPWESSSLIGRFSLRPGGAQAEEPRPGLVILPAEPSNAPEADKTPEPGAPAVAAAEPSPPVDTAAAPMPAQTEDAGVATPRPPIAEPVAPDVAAVAPAETISAAETPATPAPAQAAVAPAPPEIAAVAPAEQTTPIMVDPKDLHRGVQDELIRIGCLSGRADGDWGRRSRDALRDWSERRRPDLAMLEPSQDVLDALRKEQSRVCTAECGVGQVERAGSCVAAMPDKPAVANSPRKPVAKASERAPAAQRTQKAAPAAARPKPDATKKTAPTTSRNPVQNCVVCPDS